MGGFDDNAAIIGDWMPPSPSPRAFFSSFFGDELGTKSISAPAGEIKNVPLFPGIEEEIVPGNADEKDMSQDVTHGNQAISFNAFSEQQKMSSRGGLLERMAARAGFNAPRLNTESIRSTDLSQSQEVRSSYLTISPGLSPTTLLDSPDFLTNSLVQPSPTTGKFPFAPSGNDRSSTSTTKATYKSKDDFIEDVNNSSFAFEPLVELGPSSFFGAASKVTPASLTQQSIPNIEVLVHSHNSFMPQNEDASRLHSQRGSKLHLLSDFSRSSAEKDTRLSNISSDPRPFDTVGTLEHSPPLDEQQDNDCDNRGSGDPNAGSGPAEDEYNWRKYGQKQVKGSEYPRSYYKCTHPNCSVKKKVERSHEGHITEIIYKGAHNHPKPLPNRRSAIGSSNALGNVQLEMSERPGMGSEGDSFWTAMQKEPALGGLEWRQDNVEVTSSDLLASEYCNASASLQAHNGTQVESGDAVDGSSTFSEDEDEDDRATHGSVSLGCDGEGDESESKRRKIDAYASEMSGATRSIREPRVVVQTTSEVDILDDGYRWRKYGQKVVKGNPNPRSYYKCTSSGCTVRKHVERASHDLKSVITTYEGKHNHDVPAARNSSHVNSGVSNFISTQAGGGLQSQVHMPELSQLHSGMAGFERHSLRSFGLAGRPQVGPSHGFGIGMNPPNLANLAMPGLGPNQGKLPVLPVHAYLGQPQPPSQTRPGNEMGFMLPKGEPKMEPMSEPGLNLPNGTSVYHQLMNRLPLGPQM